MHQVEREGGPKCGLLASVAGGHGVLGLVLNMLPPPPFVPPNMSVGLEHWAGCCDIVVLASWVQIALVGEFTFPIVVFAVRCLR